MKHFFAYLLCGAALVAAASCNNEPATSPTASSAPDEANTTQTVVAVPPQQASDNAITVKALTIIDQIMGEMRSWVDFYQSKNTAFDIGNMVYTATQATQLQPKTAVMDKDFTDKYGKWLVASPNGKRLLDLYSYHLVMERNAKGKWECRGLNNDSEVAIIDPAAAKRTRLLFMGTGTVIDNGFWLDDDNVVVVGISEHNQHGKPNPVLWQINLANGQIDQFDYIDDLKIATLDAYLQQRFKGLACY